MEVKYILAGILALLTYKLLEAVRKQLKGPKLDPSRVVTVCMHHAEQKDLSKTISMLWDEKYIVVGHTFSYKGSMYVVESITEGDSGVYILANYVE